MNWWETPIGKERLEFEIQALRDAGIVCTKNDDAFSEGMAVLDLEVKIEPHQQLKLQVVFPEAYPRAPFNLFAPSLQLAHHQNPYEKNLCLLGNPLQEWRTTDTVVEFIKERLPDVLKAGMTDDKNSLEVPRSEPASTYLRFSYDSTIFFDGAWAIDPISSGGKLKIGLNIPPNNGVIRGAVLEVTDQDGKVLATAEKALFNAFPRTMAARWVRFDTPPPARDLNLISEEIIRKNHRLNNPHFHKFGQEEIDVVGVLFPEEVDWRESGDGWFFFSRTKAGKSPKLHPQLIRGLRAGRLDLQGRNPALVGLQERSVAVFGLGCLGGPFVLELARCGIGDLRLLDCDYVEPGTTVRWPYGLTFGAGKMKVSCLRQMLALDYPFTSVSYISDRNIGTAFWQKGETQLSEGSIFASMLDGADLVVDGTAEVVTQHIISAAARERGLPYILLAGTPGMWGGRVVRVRNDGHQGCWFCYSYAVESGDIEPPVVDESCGLVAPRGCSAPTFTGTSFDAMEITMAGVRLAVSTLLEGVGVGYPAIDWDVGVVNLRDCNGHPIPPTWKTYSLPRHPNCPICNLA